MVIKNLPDVHKLSVYIIKAFFLAFPLYLLPITFDVIELNKAIFVLIFAVVLLITLALKGVKEGEFKLSVGYMTLPLALLLVATVLSFFSSTSTTYSLWGFYGSLSNSLPVLIALILLPKLISTHLETKEDVSDVMFFGLMGMGAVLVHAVLNYFGVFSSAAETSLGFLNNPAFSFFGSIAIQKFMAIIVSFVAAHYVLRYQENITRLSLSAGVLLLSLLTSFLYYDAMTLVMALLAMGLALYIYKGLFHSKAFFALIGVVVITLGLFIVKMNPSVADNLGLLRDDLPETQTINFRTSWAVTNSVIGSRLPFGSGIGTFSSDYAAFKPRSINNTDLWDTRFTKPSSLYLLILAEMGLVGFLSFVYLSFRFVTHGLGPKGELTVPIKNDSYDPLRAELSVVKITVLALLLVFLFTPGNAYLLGAFFSLLGLTLALEKINKTGRVRHQKIGFAVASDAKDKEVSSLVISGYSVVQLHVLVVLIAIVAASGAGFFGYKVFASDLAYRSYFNSPTDLIALRESYRKAAVIHRDNDFYQRSVIQVNQEIARVLAQQNNENEELTDEDKQNNINDIQTLLSEATARVDYITNDTDLGINPVNWELRGQLHQNLIGLNEQSEVTALQSYNVASGLDPLNPRIIATIGTVYYRAENYEQARQLFERAVILKPDYAAARFNLANSLEQLERIPEAIQVANTILGIVDVDSDDHKAVTEYIAGLNKKLEDANAKKADSDSGIDLTGDQTVTNQPGLTDPSQPLQSSPETSTVPSEVVTGNENSTEFLPGQAPNTEEGGGFIESNQ